MEVETLQGEKFTVNIANGTVSITGGDILPVSNVIGTDVEASNGVVHLIDQVLIPPTISEAQKAGAGKPNLVELVGRGRPRVGRRTRRRRSRRKRSGRGHVRIWRAWCNPLIV